MPIRYKVVEKNSRLSCIADGLYELQYKKGQTVKAPEGTLGIMTFEKREYAKAFAAFASYRGTKSWIILRVKPIGRGKRPARWILFVNSEHTKI